MVEGALLATQHAVRDPPTPEPQGLDGLDASGYVGVQGRAERVTRAPAAESARTWWSAVVPIPGAPTLSPKL